MQFDVIIGNPPYQMTGGAGGTSDSSIYHLFVQQALKLEARFVSMVLPSRWMAGGRGLDEFRSAMLNGGNIRSLADFPDSSSAFPGVQIKGGICYFLWNRDQPGPCDVTRFSDGVEQIQPNRLLGEFDVFIRDERALSILRKVIAHDEASVVSLISGDTPFGIATNFDDWSAQKGAGRIPLHLISKGKRTIGFIKRSVIQKNVTAVDVWKVLAPKAYGAGETFPHQILVKKLCLHRHQLARRPMSSFRPSPPRKLRAASPATIEHAYFAFSSPSERSLRMPYVRHTRGCHSSCEIGPGPTRNFTRNIRLPMKKSLS